MKGTNYHVVNGKRVHTSCREFMPKETPMPDNLQEETSAFADACEETNLNENRSEKTPKMSTNLSENVVAIRSTNDLALYESEEIDKHNTPEDLIADTKEFE